MTLSTPQIVGAFKDMRRYLLPICADRSDDQRLTAPPRRGRNIDKLINDGFAEICAKYSDEFLRLGEAGPDDCRRRRSARSDTFLQNGALGVQVSTTSPGRADDEQAFEPFFAAMDKLEKGRLWMHPARAAFPGLSVRLRNSKYEIWWNFGWSLRDRGSI